ncbi:MAG: IS4 family transposase, partial [Terracidiphilus sp.]
MRKIASLRRALEKAEKISIAHSAFYKRFTAELAELVRAAVVRAMTVVAAEPKQALAGMLRSFKDLVVTDGSVVRLHHLLASAYRACRTNHTQAAAKLHVVMSVFGNVPSSVKITDERTHENKMLKIGKWVKDRLLLFDLGYYDFGLFDRIDQAGGFFISRLKQKGNPVITGVNGTGGKPSVNMVGERLRDVLARFKGAVLDVQVEVRFRRRAYRGKRAWCTCILRVVAVYNLEADRYHIYITNIPVERLIAEHVARTYAARWEIELLFNEMKGYYALEEIPSSSEEVVETLLWATILTSIVSRTLLAAMRRYYQALDRRIPARRFAA